MMSWAFDATAEQTRRTMKVDDWPWLDKVQISFIIIAVLMALFALFFLCIGFTATGATRENMYKDNESQCGGKLACAISMVLDFVLLAGWLIIISIVSMLAIFYYFFDRLCLKLPAYSEADCIDLHVFWPLVASFANSNLRVCGGDAQQFCALSSTAFTWYVIGWVGCALVILGLLLFFGIHSSNYAHIGNVNRYFELQQFRAIDDESSPNDRWNKKLMQQQQQQQRRIIEAPRSATTMGWNDSRQNFSIRSSSTRHAEAMSDSVSQFDYRRDKRPKPVY